MIELDKLNSLAYGQQKHLHESVGQFIADNIVGMKELRLVDESILDEYISETKTLREDLYGRKIDSKLNNILHSIITAAEIKTESNVSSSDDNVKSSSLEVLASLTEHFHMCFYQMKNVDVSFSLIKSLSDCEVKVSEFNGIPDSNIRSSVEDGSLFLDFSLPFDKSNWNLVQNISELHLEYDDKQYYVGTGDFYIESTNNDLNANRISGRIRINQIVDRKFDKSGKSYFRCMIPIGSVDWNRDIHTRAAFIKNGWTSGLIELKDGDTMLHVYPCREVDKYMVVESINTTTATMMNEYVYCVALTLGFITGAIHLGRCFLFSSPESEFVKQVAMEFHTMRPSSDTGMKIFTTNMYFVREILKANNVSVQHASPLFNEQEEFQPHLQDWLQADIMQSLFELIHSDDKIARAVVTLIESANFPLEYQASVRAVVLETLAHSKPGEHPVPDKKVWNDMSKEFTAIVKKYETEKEDKRISKEGADVLIKKIGSMNNPTNADSLVQPFAEVGYSVTDNDKAAIKMRDKLLHGQLVKGTVKEQTDQLYYYSIMFHKLACIIILKKAGFNGYILNNAVLSSCEKAVSSGEDALLLI